MKINVELRDLTFGDLQILTCLRREKSLRAISRLLLMEPAGISKRLKFLEDKFGFLIVKRSSQGFLLTGEGSLLTQRAETLLTAGEELLTGTQTVDHTPIRSYSLGSRGFLNILFSAPLIGALSMFDLKARMQFIDLSPDELRQAMFSGVVDLGLHFEKLDLTSAWLSEEIAELNWGLFARKNHPLSNTTSLEEVLRYPFVAPGYWNGTSLAVGNDMFPIHWRDRIKGHEVQTAFNAVRVLDVTDQLVFLPILMAQEWVISGRLRLLEVVDLAAVKAPLVFSVQQDKVSQKTLQTFKRAIVGFTKTELRKPSSKIVRS